jgi:hypothetical protein
MDVNTNPSTLQPIIKVLSFADNLINRMDKLESEFNKSKTNQSDSKTNPSETKSKPKSKSNSSKTNSNTSDIPSSIKRRIGLLNGIAYHLITKKQIKTFKRWLDELIVNTQLLANNEIDTASSDDNE